MRRDLVFRALSAKVNSMVKLNRELDKLSTFGQRLLVEPQGTQLTFEEAKALEQLQPCGIMLRARNFAFRKSYSEWLALYERLLTDIRNAIGRESLIVSIDHEGGRVVRPPQPITRFPYARAYANSCREVAQAMALELKSLGVNMSCAPVADIDEGSPVIQQRAFSSRRDEVCVHALEFASGLMMNGIAPVAKHFPGHGAAAQDSHFALPVVQRTLEELREHELQPFKALIEAGVPAIMTAHLLLPKVDPKEPATTSRKILSEILREELGFQGVVIADALGMKAISDKVQENSLSIAGMRATLDVFAFVGDSVSLQDALNTAQEMQSAVRLHKVEEQEFFDSISRIEVLLSGLNSYPVQALDSSVFERHAALAKRLDPLSEWTKFQYIPAGFD
ncbi:MAG: beta-N-acetylhexosaminidase [Oligoflexia bacterium]|nr:beta-N-acetylhexosaminidase [Oligoflexia bacterium]